jgi:predicted CXXCH cytochrome family protein
MALAFAVAGVATSLPAQAQIASTKHNLGSSGTGVNKFGGSAEICVFCHTPHGADTTAVVPLWNRKLTGTVYQTYDSLGTTTLNGKVAPVGSVSIACLSCHDGTQAMSTVINAPGSGSAGDANWNNLALWSGADQLSGKMINTTTTLSMLGTDLRNDHPVGIQYGGGGISATAPTAATNDPDFKAPKNTTMNGTVVWWLDTEAVPNGTRQKTDMILYTRAAGAGYTGQTAAEPFVECASCHDPHTNANPTFLRVSNAGSAVCLSCHIK